MEVIKITLQDLENAMLEIGFVNENLHTQVQIDCEDVFTDYPSATPSLAVSPPTGDPYPVIVTQNENTVIWDVSASDLAEDGFGKIQLSFTQDSVVVKSYTARTYIKESIVPSGSAPSPIDDWITEANELIGELSTAIPTAVDEAMSAVTVEATTLPAGSSATASFNVETKVLSIGIPESAIPSASGVSF